MLVCSHCGWLVFNINGEDVHQITGTIQCPEQSWWTDPSAWFEGATLDPIVSEVEPEPFTFEVHDPTVWYIHDSCTTKHRTMAAVEGCSRRRKVDPSAVSRHVTPD